MVIKTSILSKVSLLDFIFSKLTLHEWYCTIILCLFVCLLACLKLSTGQKVVFFNVCRIIIIPTIILKLFKSTKTHYLLFLLYFSQL
jgi:hypothetical protein